MTLLNVALKGNEKTKITTRIFDRNINESRHDASKTEDILSCAENNPGSNQMHGKFAPI